jgi:hypothetical protein
MTPGYPAATELGQSVSSGATSITPVSLAGLTAPCYLVIQNEIIYCPTAPVGGAFTGVTRGALGSVAAAHTASTPLYGLYSDLFPYSSAAEFMGAIAAELVTVETRLETAIGGGTVTSVALTMPAEFTVAGSPITNAGTLAVSKATQPANEVYAGPTTGAAAAPTFRALVTADLPAGAGTVTSVGLTMPAEFSVAGSPITGAGTLAVSKATQPANEVYAGPTTGAAAAPTFRALVAADLPAGAGTVTSVALTMPAEFSVAGSPITGAGTLAVSKATQPANDVYAGPTTGAPAAPTFRALVSADLPVATTGQLGAVEPDGTTITITGGVISAVAGGSVTSVALTMPAEFSVAGSPITGAGTLAVSKATQPANDVYAGPTTGAAAAPTFRALVSADLPIATTSQLGAVQPDGTTITVAAGVISAAGGSGAFTRIGQVVVSSPQATISFSSIPGTYSALQLVFADGQSSAAVATDGVVIEFNGDSTASHYQLTLLDYNAAGSSSGNAGGFGALGGGFGSVTGASGATGVLGSASSLFLPRYTGLASGRIHIALYNAGVNLGGSGVNFQFGAGGILWQSNAAITSIQLSLSSGGNFTSGVATLYGLQ